MVQFSGGRSRSWGHTPPSTRPFLPLSGSKIVVDHPGLLEVYQSNASFSSEEGAIDYISRIRGANEPTLVSMPGMRVNLGDEMIVWQRNPEAENGERTVGVAVRLRRFVIGFSFQGGRKLAFSEVFPFVENAFSKVKSACGGDVK